MSVVLPIPLRPSIATLSPAGIASETSESTTASPYPAVRPSMTRRSGIQGLPEIDCLDAGVARNLSRQPIGKQRTVDQYGNPIGKREHQVHVVLDQQHGHVLRQCRDRRKDVAALAFGNPR